MMPKALSCKQRKKRVLVAHVMNLIILQECIIIIFINLYLYSISANENEDTVRDVDEMIVVSDKES
jgi:hypothetical protein